MIRDYIVGLFSEEALAELALPGGYSALYLRARVTGAPICLDSLDVPLGLADHILWAHSDAMEAEKRSAEDWEATLEDLAEDLYVRCAELEQRLAALNGGT